MSKIPGLLLIAGCMTLGLGRPASAALPAGAIALTPNAMGAYQPLIFDGLTVTATACKYSDGVIPAHQTEQACNGSAHLYLVPTTGPGNVANISIEEFLGGVQGPVLSYTCPANGNCPTNGTYDLSLTLAVTNDAPTLTRASSALVGSATPASLDSDVSVGESVTGVTGCSGGLPVSLTTPIASCTFSPVQTLTVVKDFHLTLNNGFGNGDTLTLTSLTESFAPVPEPASVATLLGALAALAAVRGKRRRA